MHTTVGECLDIPVEARLYEAVTNGAELRRRLAAREVDAAFIDAELVVDLFPVLIAAHQAVDSARAGTLTAHSVHAQLLLCLSGGKSLSTALRRFGVSALTHRLLVVVLPPSEAGGGGNAAAAAATATATATATGAATTIATATGAVAGEGALAPPATPSTAPTAAAAAVAAAAAASPPPPSPPPPPPNTAAAAFDGIAGVEVADVAAGLAAGAVSRAAVTAAAYKVGAEELAAGGREGMAALVNAIATRVATREVVAK